MVFHHDAPPDPDFGLIPDEPDDPPAHRFPVGFVLESGVRLTPAEAEDLLYVSDHDSPTLAPRPGELDSSPELIGYGLCEVRASKLRLADAGLDAVFEMERAEAEAA